MGELISYLVLSSVRNFYTSFLKSVRILDFQNWPITFKLGNPRKASLCSTENATEKQPLVFLLTFTTSAQLF